jgi:hypothetical protein
MDDDIVVEAVGLGVDVALGEQNVASSQPVDVHAIEVWPGI